ncbi:hypothetical protein BV25DRAFT_1816386 [Artomyces pyxidatus]|uniref:Uncharacterized protein n=1 Tax=Artomyces pyxidatus TaxID=48021 RepID=A0ACB8SFS9_9AGAM|nr:hypothetical protein BV25DRAFT_1816386 [Artomyces pyxidatus]
MSGFGYWIPSLSSGFLGPLPPDTSVPDTIFWYEALCVVTALEWAAALPSPPNRLAIYTDNLNTVQMFASLKAQPGYNDLLLYASRILLRSHIDLRVFHIAGELNVIADALSRGLLDVLRQYAPNAKIFQITPPRVTLGSSGC